MLLLLFKEWASFLVLTTCTTLISTLIYQVYPGTCIYFLHFLHSIQVFILTLQCDRSSCLLPWYLYMYIFLRRKNEENSYCHVHTCFGDPHHNSSVAWYRRSKRGRYIGPNNTRTIPDIVYICCL